MQCGAPVFVQYLSLYRIIRTNHAMLLLWFIGFLRFFAVFEKTFSEIAGKPLQIVSKYGILYGNINALCYGGS